MEQVAKKRVPTAAAVLANKRPTTPPEALKQSRNWRG